MPVHSDPEVIRLLAAATFFQGLDRATLESVAQTAVEHLYQPDQLVILEGEPSVGLFIIQWGRLKASKMALDGREQILELLGAGGQCLRHPAAPRYGDGPGVIQDMDDPSRGYASAPGSQPTAGARRDPEPGRAGAPPGRPGRGSVVALGRSTSGALAAGKVR